MHTYPNDTPVAMVTVRTERVFFALGETEMISTPFSHTQNQMP